MQKSIMSVLVAFAIVLFISMPAQASSQIDDGFTGTPQSQPLPVFMQDLEFTPMTEAEMAEVRGAKLPWWIKLPTTQLAHYLAVVATYGDAVVDIIGFPLCAGEWCQYQ